ncbi:MAG: ABC-F family ATP-binding cassette domain-containing protein [Clostridium sp.]|nr:ABC-F family ATP-binding cassette domain-containing protein [Clostridium sp.]MDY3828222.1 ABC-F family ATP-binding cassette domain-containing protein [Clostridium sp.]
MNYITLEKIYKSYSEKVLLKNVSLTVNEGDKIGIIGINGAGKSTLLKILAGKDEFFDGEMTKNKNVRIEYLSQRQEFDDNSTILEQIFKSDTKEMKLIKEYEELLGSDDQERLLKCQEQIDALNLWSIESEAKTVLTKLGINDFNELIGNLSGGQKKRVALATALITPCDLLILDEPTNHLDSSSIEWLENYLNNRKGALVMITHDRYFLDRVSNKTFELDRGTLYAYDGNYSKFLEKKMERLEREESEEKKRQSLIRKELKWVRRGAKARSTKQKARLMRFEELVNREYVKPNTDIEVNFIGTRLGKKIIELENISKSYDSKTLFNDFSYIFTKEDRIGIIGENGVGKSTLINILRGKLMPDSGTIEVGETVKIGCFSQEDTHMDPNMKAIDYIKEGGEIIPVADGTKITASTLCERFLFDGTLQYTKIEKLSGGERRRLHLLRVLMSAPNVLLLDEPTNDLDINTLNILEDFLDDFVGVIVTVSHDRYFLDRICNKIFAYEDGKINIYLGNYSDYEITQEVNRLEREKILIKEKKEDSYKNRVKPQKVKFTFNEAQEFKNIDSVISDLENRIYEIDKEIAENPTNYELLQKLTEEKEEMEIELLEKYERKEYLDKKNKEIEESRN